MKRTILLTAAILCAAGTRAQEAYDLLIPEPTRQAEISYAVFCLKKKNLIRDEGTDIGGPPGTYVQNESLVLFKQYT